MKLVALTLLGLLTLGVVRAEELFSARCVPVLTKSSCLWRIADAKDGLAVEYSDAKGKKSAAIVTGSEAERLRVQVASLQLAQSDVDLLRSLVVTRPAKQKEEETIMLRPFDGVTYQFSILGSDGVRSFWIDNPAFDLEYHPQLKETIRLKELLTFLEFLERRAKGENEAK